MFGCSNINEQYLNISNFVLKTMHDAAAWCESLILDDFWMFLGKNTYVYLIARLLGSSNAGSGKAAEVHWRSWWFVGGLFGDIAILRQEFVHPACEELVAEDEEVLLLERLEPAIVEAQTISNVYPCLWTSSSLWKVNVHTVQ